mmetsp:Transcript_23150/g.34288  ORF Transcript_23150/g.34288 Transcript_23150/m.34288 type:complete len:221 (-) Transcript_23150:31-693(-)
MSGNENEALNSWEKYESQGSSKSGAFQTTVTDAFESQQAEFDPSRTCAHKIFVSYSAIAGIFAGLLGLGQFLGMAIEDLPAEVNEAVRYSLSIYLIIMCGLAVLTELEWFSFIIKSRLLTNWVSRGLVYIFMSLLSIDQASLGETTNERELRFIKVVSYIFAAIGVGYFGMGCLCMQIWLSKLREEHQIRRKGGNLKKRDAKRNNAIIKNPKEFDSMEIA